MIDPRIVRLRVARRRQRLGRGYRQRRDLLGRQLLAVGGEVEALEQGVMTGSPEFFAYLSMPVDQPVPIGFVPV